MNEQALKERLKTIANIERRTFNEVWRGMVLERLLVRISHSKHSKNFIFKGGLLLSYYLAIGRETKDADFRRRLFAANLKRRVIYRWAILLLQGLTTIGP